MSRGSGDPAKGGARPDAARPPFLPACTRRRFLEISALAGAATATGGLALPTPSLARGDAPMPDRIDDTFPLAELTLADLQSGLESGA
ncbi:MAG: twin-arginine translocation signal domain-containing protein, partial [Gemmatimonadota bacterium]